MIIQKIHIIPIVCIYIGLFPQFAAAKWRPIVKPIGNFRLEIVVDRVNRPKYHLDGLRHIEGRRGEKYIIRLHNRAPHRTEVVICVDGRDVIDGEPCDLGKRGYVVNPWSYIDIDGYRLSMTEVATFRFGDVVDSYAYRMAQPHNIGIIHAAWFPEKIYRYKPLRPLIREKSRPQRGDLPLAQSENYRWDTGNLGTVFGERRRSIANETSFNRRNWSSPNYTSTIYYDDRAGLCNRGLTSLCHYFHPPLTRPKKHDFAKPPPGWEHFYTND